MSNDTTVKTRPTHNAFIVRKYKVNGEHRSEYTQISARRGLTATATVSTSSFRPSPSAAA